MPPPPDEAAPKPEKRPLAKPPAAPPARSVKELAKDSRDLATEIRALRAQKRALDEQLAAATRAAGVKAEARLPIEPGHIFWAESDGIGQEEQGRHPWIVVSVEAFHYKAELVLAVPATSNPFGHAFDVEINHGDFVAYQVENANDRLHKTGDKQIRVAKARKVSHFSTLDVVPVGKVTDRVKIKAIIGKIMTAMGV